VLLPARALALPAVLLAAALGASACSSADATASGARIGVTAGDGTCELTATSVPAGVVTFAVQNTGSQAAEFYVYAADGTTILSEVENVGPGVTRELVVELTAGTAKTTCRPSDGVEGISNDLTVTATGASSAAARPSLAKAVEQYRGFVAEETAALLAGTEQFVAAVTDGDVARAKALYPQVRTHWERIEPVVESFADLDYSLDAREDGVEPGTEWTGWHRLEKALWIDASLAGMTPIADQLLADTRDLVGRIPSIELSPSLIGNGATALMEEVATGKVTGEEERYSRTDLWDFQANVDGARAAYDALAPALKDADPGLAATLESRFATLQAKLDALKQGDGFVLYDDLSKAQVRELADAVDALAEPLSNLTASVVNG
jgi:iron uptake system component EfeO